jgi:thiol-disulfide isomerase/thioredoxin
MATADPSMLACGPRPGVAPWGSCSSHDEAYMTIPVARCLRLVTALVLALASAAAAEEDPAALLERAERQLSRGDARAAATLFEKLRKADARYAPEAQWGLARAALTVDDRKKAIALVDALLGANPAPLRRVELLTLKGVALSRGRSATELDGAEAAFRAAAEIGPGRDSVLYNLGIVQLKRGRAGEGLASLEQCRAAAPDGPLARRAARVLRRPQLAGKTLAPDFSIETTGGRQSLADLEGHAVLLDFWATWCGPCVASVPELRELRRKWSTERLVVISVSADQDEGAWRDFLAGHDMAWPQYRDADGSLRRLFRVSAYPTYVLVDPDGAEVKRVAGLETMRSVGSRLKSELEAVLGKAN